MNIKLPIASQWRWMPIPASEYAEEFNCLFSFLIWTGFGLFLIVIVPLIIFLVKYRFRSNNLKASSQKDHNFSLELIWTILPIIYLSVCFVWGFNQYINIVSPKYPSIKMNVIGQKWHWSVQYLNQDMAVSGRDVVIGVPVNINIQLRLISQDVIHSFFLPNFRIKQDVLPGRYTILSFTPNKIGEFPVFCAEYCGVLHSNMLAKLKVMPYGEYANWVANIKYQNVKSGQVSITEQGKKLYFRYCASCHARGSGYGTIPYMPTSELRKRTDLNQYLLKLKDDIKYLNNPNSSTIRNYILSPGNKEKISKMPSFQQKFTEFEIHAIVKYLHTNAKP